MTIQPVSDSPIHRDSVRETTTVSSRRRSLADEFATETTRSSTSTGTPPSTASSSARSPRKCTPSAPWHGRTSTTATGSPRAATRCSTRPLPSDLERSRPPRGTRGYKGITIPTAQRATVVRGGILEMDDPEHRNYRGALNPYLSPAAIKRWIPFIDEIAQAAPRREDRDRPNRLRRRPGQHRARGPHAGDDGHPAQEVDDLLRAGPRRRSTPRRIPPTPRASQRCTGRWASTCSPT